MFNFYNFLLFEARSLSVRIRRKGVDGIRSSGKEAEHARRA